MRRHHHLLIKYEIVLRLGPYTSMFILGVSSGTSTASEIVHGMMSMRKLSMACHYQRTILLSLSRKPVADPTDRRSRQQDSYRLKETDASKDASRLVRNMITSTGSSKAPISILR